MCKSKVIIAVLSIALAAESIYICNEQGLFKTEEVEVVEVIEEHVVDRSVSEFMQKLYKVTQYPELDEDVINAIRLYEDIIYADENTDKLELKNTPLYSGSYTACNKFMRYMNYQWGYVRYLETKMEQVINEENPFDITYRVVWKDKDFSEEKLKAYKQEAIKAKATARGLKVNYIDNRETIPFEKYVGNWIIENIHYNEGDATTEGPYDNHSYGMYRGEDVKCTGFSMAMYQLLSINGIRCDIIYVETEEGGHALNRVFMSVSGWVYYEPQNGKISMFGFSGQTRKTDEYYENIDKELQNSQLNYLYRYTLLNEMDY